jgi:hypothetical protein
MPPNSLSLCFLTCPMGHEAIVRVCERAHLVWSCLLLCWVGCSFAHDHKSSENRELLSAPASE